jgi:hypothetical protein
MWRCFDMRPMASGSIAERAVSGRQPSPHIAETKRMELLLFGMHGGKFGRPIWVPMLQEAEKLRLKRMQADGADGADDEADAVAASGGFAARRERKRRRVEELAKPGGTSGM